MGFMATAAHRRPPVPIRAHDISVEQLRDVAQRVDTHLAYVVLELDSPRSGVQFNDGDFQVYAADESRAIKDTLQRHGMTPMGDSGWYTRPLPARAPTPLPLDLQDIGRQKQIWVNLRDKARLLDMSPRKVAETCGMRWRTDLHARSARTPNIEKTVGIEFQLPLGFVSTAELPKWAGTLAEIYNDNTCGKDMPLSETQGLVVKVDDINSESCSIELVGKFRAGESQYPEVQTFFNANFRPLYDHFNAICRNHSRELEAWSRELDPNSEYGAEYAKRTVLCKILEGGTTGPHQPSPALAHSSALLRQDIRSVMSRVSGLKEADVLPRLFLRHETHESDIFNGLQVTLDYALPDLLRQSGMSPSDLHELMTARTPTANEDWHGASWVMRAGPRQLGLGPASPACFPQHGFADHADTHGCASNVVRTDRKVFPAHRDANGHLAVPIEHRGGAVKRMVADCLAQNRPLDQQQLHRTGMQEVSTRLQNLSLVHFLENHGGVPRQKHTSAAETSVNIFQIEDILRSSGGQPLTPLQQRFREELTQRHESGYRSIRVPTTYPTDAAHFQVRLDGPGLASSRVTALDLMSTVNPIPQRPGWNYEPKHPDATSHPSAGPHFRHVMTASAARPDHPTTRSAHAPGRAL
jgi:hypothetical protein